jgi:hypothetical protein
MLGFGFALVVIVLWARFAFGHTNLDAPFESQEALRNRIIFTRVLSIGFVLVAVAALASPALALTSPLYHWLVPLGVLFCIPGLVAVHRLRAHLETRGGPAKPAMAWLDREILAGWSAVCFGALWWGLTTLPFLPSIP